MLNESGKYYLLADDGTTVVEGEGNPLGVTVLACPGGDVTADLVRRIPGLAEKLGPPKAVPKVAKVEPEPEAKMVRSDRVENKAVAAPAATKAKGA